MSIDAARPDQFLCIDCARLHTHVSVCRTSVRDPDRRLDKLAESRAPRLAASLLFPRACPLARCFQFAFRSLTGASISSKCCAMLVPTRAVCAAAVDVACSAEGLDHSRRKTGTVMTDTPDMTTPVTRRATVRDRGPGTKAQAPARRAGDQGRSQGRARDLGARFCCRSSHVTPRRSRNRCVGRSR
jgi:hypothetical protein